MRIPKAFVMKKVREKCLDCCAYQPKEVKLCPAEDCPLWLIRFGSQSAAKIPKLQAYLDTLPKVDMAGVFAKHQEKEEDDLEEEGEEHPS
jgi:hypothetical protein